MTSDAVPVITKPTLTKSLARSRTKVLTTENHSLFAEIYLLF